MIRTYEETIKTKESRKNYEVCSAILVTGGVSPFLGSHLHQSRAGTSKGEYLFLSGEDKSVSNDLIRYSLGTADIRLI